MKKMKPLCKIPGMYLMIQLNGGSLSARAQARHARCVQEPRDVPHDTTERGLLTLMSVQAEPLAQHAVHEPGGCEVQNVQWFISEMKECSLAPE